LTNCDILIQEDFVKIYDFHKKSKNLVTIVSSLKTFKIPYGVIELGSNKDILKMKEKPELTFLVNTGVYFVEIEVLNHLKKDENIGFPDLIQRLMNQGFPIGVYPISESKWLDMGQMEDLENMRKILYEKKP